MKSLKPSTSNLNLINKSPDTLAYIILQVENTLQCKKICFLISLTENSFPDVLHSFLKQIKATCYSNHVRSSYSFNLSPFNKVIKFLKINILKEDENF